MCYHLDDHVKVTFTIDFKILKFLSYNSLFRLEILKGKLDSRCSKLSHKDILHLYDIQVVHA